MTTKDQLHRFVDQLPESGATIADLDRRLERLRQDAQRHGLSGNLLDRLLHLLNERPIYDQLERLVHWAEVEAAGDPATEFQLFLAAVAADPTLFGDMIEDFLRALVFVGAPVRPQPAVTLSEVAARLRQLSLPGDGFADDLEAVQAAQSEAGAPSWLP